MLFDNSNDNSISHYSNLGVGIVEFDKIVGIIFCSPIIYRCFYIVHVVDHNLLEYGLVDIWI